MMEIGACYVNTEISEGTDADVAFKQRLLLPFLYTTGFNIRFDLSLL